jgi:hypothetical protein
VHASSSVGSNLDDMQPPPGVSWKKSKAKKKQVHCTGYEAGSCHQLTGIQYTSMCCLQLIPWEPARQAKLITECLRNVTQGVLPLNVTPASNITIHPQSILESFSSCPELFSLNRSAAAAAAAVLLPLQVKGKDLDYYALLGLQNERFLATEAQLRTGVLFCHQRQH